MFPELEKQFAALVTEIDGLGVAPANLQKVREQLTGITKAAENLCGQTAAEFRRIALAESSPSKSESYYKRLFEQSHRAMVVVDPELGCFVDANSAAAKIFGYSTAEEIIGKTPPDMAAPTQYDGTDSAIASRRRDKSALNRGIESFEWRHQRPNGEIWDAIVHLMTFEFRGRRLLQATLEDITEHRKTQEALRESRQLLEGVLENSPAVIYAKRKDGRYAYINREWERVCNLQRELVIGRTDYDLFPPDTAEQFRSNDLAVTRTGQLIEAEESIDTPWGPQLFLSKKVPLISTLGEVDGLCGISTNITDQRRNESHLRDAIATLERERENKLMNVEAIIASIAHEVRQPLTAISSNISAALRFLGQVPPNYDEMRRALDRAVNESQRATGIFDNIRALFRKVSQERELIDLNEIVREALQSLHTQLTNYDVVVQTKLVPELPRVEGHRGQLEEVIINLVNNAIEAMGAIPDRSRVLQIRTERDGEKSVTVSLEDTGPGIELDQLGRIFDAFITTKADGMGLGLAISRRIIESHGGRLSASSDGKNGALFQIILPISAKV